MRGRFRLHPRSPLTTADFRLLVLGQMTSQLGTQVSGVALPLLAVLVLQASPLQLGLVNAAGTLAFAVIGLPVGAWIDRHRRRPVLIVSDLVRSLCLVTVPLAGLLGLGGATLAQLIFVSAVVGVARVYFDIGYSSYLPTLVGTERVLAGNAALEFVRAAGQVIGPAVGGWLVVLIGAANVIGLQAATFAVSAGCLLIIRTPEPHPAPLRSRRPELVRTRIAAGLRVVLRHRVLRATAATSALSNVGFGLASAVTMLFFTRTLGLPPSVIGALLALGSLSVLAGAWATPALARRFGSARVIWLALAVTAPLTLLSPLAQPGWSVVVIVLATAAGEFGQIIYAIANVSLRQRLCPAALLGRVNATTRVFVLGAFPFGALAGGLLGNVTGPRATLWIALLITGGSVIPCYCALRGVVDVSEVEPIDWRDPEAAAQNAAAPADLGQEPLMTAKATWKPHTTHADMSGSARTELPDEVFAFPEQRKEPLTDAGHVRNAIARFDQVTDVSDADRDVAFANLQKAAKHYDIDMAETNWRQLGKKPHTDNPTS